MPLSADQRAARLERRQKKRGQKDGEIPESDDESETDLAAKSPDSSSSSPLSSAEPKTIMAEKSAALSDSTPNSQQTNPQITEKENALPDENALQPKGDKLMPVVTDISKRAVRERRPSDPLVTLDEHGTPNYGKEKQSAEKKKGGYGKYASGLRKTDRQSEIQKRKEKYAAALEGAKFDLDDLDFPDGGINYEEPDIKYTAPVKAIKDQYLSSAREEGKVVLPTEERPIPHDLQPQWPPPRDQVEGQLKPQVKVFESEETPRRDGVDAGHTDSVKDLQVKWGNLPEKYRGKPLGVHKPTIEIVGDRKWITHFRPVIDEGEAPKEPEWLSNLRHRRWMSTVKARFPEDEQQRKAFERRSTTPRKVKKENPYTVMRSKSDFAVPPDDDFELIMRKQRKRSDSLEEGQYITKSSSSFIKSASSFRSETDSTDAGGVAVLNKVPVKGPIKEYLKNLSLERARNTMLKWSFSADVVDEPYRFDLPKPIDLLIMDEMERENEWKYEQSRRRFKSEDSAADDMSLQSSSQVSFALDEDLEDAKPYKPLPDEMFLPKLTDIQQKLKEETTNKPVPKTVSLEEDASMLPKFEEAKDKYLAPVLEPAQREAEKKPILETENFEHLDKIKQKFPKPEAPKELSMPMAPVRGDKDFKKLMEDRKTYTDTTVSENEPAPSAADEIRNLADDIAKTFGEEKKGEKKEKEPTKEKGTAVEKQTPKESSTSKSKEAGKTPASKSADKKDGPKVMSVDQADSGEKKDALKSKPFQLSKQHPKEHKGKEFAIEDKKDSSSSSNLKAFADHRRKLRPVRKHAGSSNPVKAIQKRDDLRTETDFLLSKRQSNRMRDPEELQAKPVKQVKHSKHHTRHTQPVPTITPLHHKKLAPVRRNTDPALATEAIQALSAKENLAKASGMLRKTSKNLEGISTEKKDFGGFLPVMLLQIKGSRHIQTRLVEPSVKSLNSGDAFVLVTPKNVYVWIGRSANIMKKARAAEVSTIVVKQRDLGTNVKKSHFIEQDDESAATGVTSFWKHLGGRGHVADAKDFPSDEEYEKGVQATNLVYRVDYTNDPPTLKKRDDVSGRVLSEKFMDPTHAYVLDFGTEVYLWLGRSCSVTARQKGMPLAQKVFKEKFKFKSKINPMEPKKVAKDSVVREVERPSWALLGRMTARSETVLFRQKFTDWPDHNVDYTKDFVTRPVSGSSTPQLVTGRKSPEEDKCESADPADRPISLFDLKSCEVDILLERPPEPSMVLEGFDVGRGSGSVNEEGWRFNVDTIDIKTWHVKEYSYNPLPEEDRGHFHSSEGYVVRWKYCVKRAGVRTLKGHMSRQEDVGRDKVAYFFWQGRDSTVNEKGAAALMTMEIDSDRGPQILVAQGKEPPCFPRLFNGKMVVHLGKREPQEDEDEDDTCMFIARNEDPAEAYLLQVKTSIHALRSRTSFVVVDLIELLLYVWHGAKACKETKKTTLNAGKQLKKWFNEKFPDDPLELKEFDEGDETDLFWDALRGDRAHVSLMKDARKFDYTLRAFKLSSSIGQFESKELLNPSRSASHVTPYPILQSQLYSVQQPALFLIDAHYEMYMWQGWWPKSEENDVQASTTGSAQTRWSIDRRLAMETIKSYGEALKRDLTKTYIVFAGLEPKSFKALFPFWESRKDVAEINTQTGKKKGELMKLQDELARLSRDNYSLKELQQKPLPEGVDPTRLEMYLDSKEFQKTFAMTKTEFEKLPAWKKLNMKKAVKLY